MGGFLDKPGLVATALDHEVIDHAVEQGAVIVTFPAVLLEVGTGHRRLVGKQFDFDITTIGVQSDHGWFLVAKGG